MVFIKIEIRNLKHFFLYSNIFFFIIVRILDFNEVTISVFETENTF